MLELWVARCALLPAVCPVYLCANVGPQGLLVVRLPAPFVPHSTSLGPALATRVLSALVPVSAPPTEAGCSQEEGPRKGFVIGSRTQGVQEILEKCM